MMNSWLARREGYAASKTRLLEPRHEVVGVESGVLANLAHPLAPSIRM